MHQVKNSDALREVHQAVQPEVVKAPLAACNVLCFSLPISVSPPAYPPPSPPPGIPSSSIPIPHPSIPFPSKPPNPKLPLDPKTLSPEPHHYTRAYHAWMVGRD